MQKIGATAKLVLHGIVNIGGNAAIIAILPSLLPVAWVAVIFLVFNLAQVIYAFTDPSYAVHLIQTGQLAVPSAETVLPKPPVPPAATPSA